MGALQNQLDVYHILNLKVYSEVVFSCSGSGSGSGSGAWTHIIHINVGGFQGTRQQRYVGCSNSGSNVTSTHYKRHRPIDKCATLEGAGNVINCTNSVGLGWVASWLKPQCTRIGTRKTRHICI